MRALRFCALACALIGLTGRALHAATYQATDLYPIFAPNGYSTFALGNGFPITSGGITSGRAGKVDGQYFVNDAILWTPGGIINLAPPAEVAGDASVNAVNGSAAAGYGTIDLTANYHAMFWPNDTAASMVDLHPAQFGFLISYALGIGGNQQVGYANTQTDDDHAILWTGSAASAVNLHPTNFVMELSRARATDGIHQVGYGLLQDTFHALLWSGNASSTIDLNPVQLGANVGSAAFGISGAQQVGEAYRLGPNPHAMLWNGTAGSAVDLHPSQFTLFNESSAYGTNGLEQVGVADFYTAPVGDQQGKIILSHAMLWDGTAASAVDLQLSLPANFASSTAYSIDAAGDVFGIATDASGVMHAVEWTPQVPEPSGIALFMLSTVALLRRNRRRRLTHGWPRRCPVEQLEPRRLLSVTATFSAPPATPLAGMDHNTYGNSQVPDPAVAVGLPHPNDNPPNPGTILESVNSNLTWFDRDKDPSTFIGGDQNNTVSLRTFWSGLGLNDITDTDVFYDRSHASFIVVAATYDSTQNPIPSRLLIAMSKTDDLGNLNFASSNQPALSALWKTVAIKTDTDTSKIIDQPRFAVTGGYIYIYGLGHAQEFYAISEAEVQGANSGTVFDDPVNQYKHFETTDNGNFEPAQPSGSVPFPAGVGDYFIAPDSGIVRTITVNGSGQPTGISQPIVVTPTGANLTSQPITTATMIDNSSASIHRAGWNNYKLYTAERIAVADDSGGAKQAIEWGQYSTPSPASNAWTLAQHGFEYGPSGAVAAGVPGLAVNANGDMLLAFNASSIYAPDPVHTTIGAFYAVHRAGDVPGTLGAVQTLMDTGAGYSYGDYYRWGDFTTVALDPQDPGASGMASCGFWICSEYAVNIPNPNYKKGNTDPFYSPWTFFNWSTAIGSYDPALRLTEDPSNPGNDSIVVGLTADGSSYNITDNGVPVTLPDGATPANISAIFINAGQGSNSLTMDSSNGLPVSYAYFVGQNNPPAVIDGTAGDDTLAVTASYPFGRATLTTSAGASQTVDFIEGGSPDLTYNSGGGNDTVTTAANLSYTLNFPSGNNTINDDNGRLNIVVGSGSDVINTIPVSQPVTVTTGTSDASITINGNDALTLNTAATGGGSESLTIGSGSAPTLTIDAASGSVTLAANAGTGIRAVNVASLTISNNALVTIADNPTHANRSVLVVANGGLNLTNGAGGAISGTLDLNDNDLIYRGLAGEQGALIHRLLAAGFNGGAWTLWPGSTGLTSSAAAATANYASGNTALGWASNGDLAYASFDGVTVGSTDVLVKYTYYGDVNLDGSVDSGTDLGQFYSNYGTVSGANWDLGDFTYDGAIDSSDLGLIYGNYQYGTSAKPGTQL